MDTFSVINKKVEEMFAAMVKTTSSASGHVWQDLLHGICKLLHTELKNYDWVGFYLVDPTTPKMLVLGPYVGEPTDHTRIAFGQGICGQAAATQKTFVIDDVSKETNYLSCSLRVKSEIVIPIFCQGRFVAELDIDSHAQAAFSDDHRAFLEQLCQRLGQGWM